MQKNTFNKYTKLIDEICSDNDYILTFQATEQVRNLVSALINLRDGKTNNLFEITQELDKTIDEVKTYILTDVGDSLLSEILEALERSKNRIVDFEEN